MPQKSNYCNASLDEPETSLTVGIEKISEEALDRIINYSEEIIRDYQARLARAIREKVVSATQNRL